MLLQSLYRKLFKSYYYEHSCLQPASRSGHTTVLVRGIRRPPGHQRFHFGLFNFGGMASGKIEMLGEFPSEKVREVDIFYDEMNRTRLKSAILLCITKVYSVEFVRKLCLGYFIQEV